MAYNPLTGAWTGTTTTYNPLPTAPKPYVPMITPRIRPKPAYVPPTPYVLPRPIPSAYARPSLVPVPEPAPYSPLPPLIPPRPYVAPYVPGQAPAVVKNPPSPYPTYLPTIMKSRWTPTAGTTSASVGPRGIAGRTSARVGPKTPQYYTSPETPEMNLITGGGYSGGGYYSGGGGYYSGGGGYSSGGGAATEEEQRPPIWMPPRIIWRL